MGRLSEKVLIGASAAILTAGVVSGMQPPSQDSQVQRSVEQARQADDQLQNADEAQKARYRMEIQSHGDAEIARQLTPGEYSPEAPDMRIRWFKL